MTPDEKDLQWAWKHGWDWVEESEIWGGSFCPMPLTVSPTTRVFYSLLNKDHGWVVWLIPCGAIQTEAPYASVRAALRVAEQIRQNRSFAIHEMSCLVDANPLMLLAREAR